MSAFRTRTARPVGLGKTALIDVFFKAMRRTKSFIYTNESVPNNTTLAQSLISKLDFRTINTLMYTLTYTLMYTLTC